MSQLCKRVQRERKRLGLTQQVISSLVGVSRETWSRYESGRLKPGIEVLAKLGEIGADLSYVVTGNPNPPRKKEATAMAPTTTDRAMLEHLTQHASHCCVTPAADTSQMLSASLGLESALTNGKRLYIALLVVPTEEITINQLPEGASDDE